MQERERSLEGLKNLMDELAANNDPYSPQFLVAAGPNRANLEKAFREKTTINLAIDYRTADFGDSESDEEFGYAVGTIRELYYEEGEGHMLLVDFESFGRMKAVAGLAWSYRNGVGGVGILSQH